jgi:hypothetical protein
VQIRPYTRHKDTRSSCDIIALCVQTLITALLWKEGSFTHIPGCYFSGYEQSLAPLQKNCNGKAGQIIVGNI